MDQGYLSDWIALQSLTSTNVQRQRSYVYKVEVPVMDNLGISPCRIWGIRWEIEFNVCRIKVEEE